MDTASARNSGPHVVVAGGGPVGLSAALLLHRAGIRCTVLERDRRPSVHPKARGIRTRTMELFAQWGLEDDVRRTALPAGADRFIYCDSLVGAEIARTAPVVEPDIPVSPSGTCRVSQDIVHDVLRAKVAGLDGVEVRTGATVVGVEQYADHVVLTTESGGRAVADYVIAADGAGSTVRKALGVRMEGRPVLGYGQSIYWRGDLHEWTAHRMCVQFVTGHRSGHPANIATVDGRERWITMLMRPAGAERPALPTEAEAIEIINRAVGTDVAPRIIDITTWRLSAQVAERWRVGRAFLAGDAAHTFPPTGGFGMNTGVQDVHNLVWKLALVLKHAADETLLDTYETERIEVARSNAAWSVANGDRMRDIGTAIARGDRTSLADLLEAQRSHVDATDQDLGFGYDSGAIMAPAPGETGAPLRVARTGHRFPETAVVINGEKRSSVLSLVDGFTVVTADPPGWAHAARRASRPGLPVAVVESLPEPLGGHAAALVRPDGIVAWRAPAGGPPDRLAAVIAALLG